MMDQEMNNGRTSYLICLLPSVTAQDQVNPQNSQRNGSDPHQV
jgi:hypothetical protein